MIKIKNMPSENLQTAFPFSDGLKPLRQPNPQCGQGERAENVQGGCGQCRAPLLRLQKPDGFQRKGGKSRQAAEKAGNQQQPPLRIVQQLGADADKKRARPVGGQRAECKRRRALGETQAQKPAADCAE